MTRLVALLAFLVAPALAMAQSAQEIADRASEAAFYKGDDGRGQISMVIRDAGGGERTRKMTMLRQNAGAVNGPQNVYVHFSRPADVNKTAFLVWKHPGKDDDRWLYLPALDVVRRIAASDERTSFVGSHFFYEDVSGRGPDEDTHTLLRTTDNYFVLESRPKDAGGVEFDHFHAYIHKTTFLPTRVEYFKADGRKYRTYEALAVENIQGIPTVVQARMSDEDMGGATEVTYSGVRYGVGFPGDVFTERSLRAAPRKFLR